MNIQISNINVIKKLKFLVKKTYASKLYPKHIQLVTAKQLLNFDVFSSIEEYRISNYGGEESFVSYLTQILHKDDVVFDIGASVGLITVHAATFASTGQVFAFEPDPETMGRLKHNVEINKLSNVKFIPWAVGNRRGTMTLFSDGASGYAPTLAKQSGRTGAPTGEIEVSIHSLDEAIISGELPLPSILKVDIEGAEILCVQGATQLLSGELGQKPRLIFLEIHPDFLPTFGSSAEEVHQILLKNDYTVIWEQRRDQQIHYCYKS